MMFIDTHTHLFAFEFDLDRQETIQKALINGISQMILPNIDCSTLSVLKETVSNNPGVCFPLFGLHPCSVNSNYKTDLEIIRKEIDLQKPVGIGECGIDLYWDKTFLNEQKEALRIQAEWAKELELPLIIHARESFNEIYEVLDSVNDSSLKGIFHCFTGTEKDVEKILGYGGFSLGIGGVVTYKTSHLPALLPSVDLKNVVLETDSPYLPPVPFRGKRNESSYLIKVAEKLSEIYQLPLEKIGKITTNNARTLFRL
jgi:TatD DNase family protein